MNNKIIVEYIWRELIIAIVERRIIPKIIVEYIWRELIIAIVERRIIPNIPKKDWENNKDEIMQQFIGAGVEAGFL